MAALLTVTDCVADVSDVLEAVRVGVPALPSRYRKLAFDDPLEIETDVIVVVFPVSRNTPAVDVLARLTVVDPLVTGLLAASRRSTVIVLVS